MKREAAFNEKCLKATGLGMVFAFIYYCIAISYWQILLKINRISYFGDMSIFFVVEEV